MQKKGKIMVVGIIVIVLVIVAMITAKKQDYKTEVSGPDDVIIDDLVYREVAHEAPKEVFANYEKSLNEADNILVEKVIRTSIEGTNGEYSTSYDSYVVSNVDVTKKSDDTEDFTAAVSAEEYDDSLIKQVAFNEGFGFSYNGLSGFGVYETLLDVEGFNCDFLNVSLDEERTKLTGQNNYTINDATSIIERLLPDYESKDVIEKKAYYQTMKQGELEVPEFFVAVVKYRDGENIVEKSLYLQISANKWEVV